MPAKFEIVSDIPWAADQLWQAVHDPAVLQHIMAPLVVLKPVEPREFPDAFVPATYTYAMYGFGLVPLGRQAINIEHPAPEPGEALPRFLMRDRGSGQIASEWTHTILIVPLGDAGSRYTDRLEIAAGALTFPVAAFARILFRHRQRRLKALAKLGFPSSLTAR